MKVGTTLTDDDDGKEYILRGYWELLDDETIKIHKLLKSIYNSTPEDFQYFEKNILSKMQISSMKDIQKLKKVDSDKLTLKTNAVKIITKKVSELNAKDFEAPLYHSKPIYILVDTKNLKMLEQYKKDLTKKNRVLKKNKE